MLTLQDVQDYLAASTTLAGSLAASVACLFAGALVGWFVQRLRRGETASSSSRVRAVDRVLWAVVSPGVAALTVGGFALSFRTLRAFAEPTFGRWAWASVLVVDVGIVVLNALDVLLRRADRYIWWVPGRWARLHRRVRLAQRLHRRHGQGPCPPRAHAAGLRAAGRDRRQARGAGRVEPQTAVPLVGRALAPGPT